MCETHAATRTRGASNTRSTLYPHAYTQSDVNDVTNTLLMPSRTHIPSQKVCAQYAQRNVPTVLPNKGANTYSPRIFQGTT